MADPHPDARLEALRARIDAVDRRMHELLIERAATVAELAAIKGVDADSHVIRPDREAAILRRLAADHRGPLPLATVAHIWRTTIAAFCTMQRPFAVHCVGLDGDAGAIRDLARFWFAFSPALEPAASPGAAVAALERAPGDVALVPLPGSRTRSRVGGTAPWWRALDADGVHVIGRVAAPGGDVLMLGGRAVGAGAGVTVAVLHETGSDDGGHTRSDVEVLDSAPGGGALVALAPSDGARAGNGGPELPPGCRPVGAYGELPSGLLADAAAAAMKRDDHDTA